MNGEPDFSICGDPYYVNLVVIDMLNTFRWSRKRRRKWLRRWGHIVNRDRAALELKIEDSIFEANAETDLQDQWEARDEYARMFEGD